MKNHIRKILREQSDFSFVDDIPSLHKWDRDKWYYMDVSELPNYGRGKQLSKDLIQNVMDYWGYDVDFDIEFANYFYFHPDVEAVGRTQHLMDYSEEIIKNIDRYEEITPEEWKIIVLDSPVTEEWEWADNIPSVANMSVREVKNSGEGFLGYYSDLKNMGLVNEGFEWVDDIPSFDLNVNDYNVIWMDEKLGHNELVDLGEWLEYLGYRINWVWITNLLPEKFKEGEIPYIRLIPQGINQRFDINVGGSEKGFHKRIRLDKLPQHNTFYYSDLVDMIQYFMYGD